MFAKDRPLPPSPPGTPPPPRAHAALLLWGRLAWPMLCWGYLLPAVLFVVGGELSVRFLWRPLRALEGGDGLATTILYGITFMATYLFWLAWVFAFSRRLWRQPRRFTPCSWRGLSWTFTWAGQPIATDAAPFPAGSRLWWRFTWRFLVLEIIALSLLLQVLLGALEMSGLAVLSWINDHPWTGNFALFLPATALASFLAVYLLLRSGGRGDGLGVQTPPPLPSAPPGRAA